MSERLACPQAYRWETELQTDAGPAAASGSVEPRPPVRIEPAPNVPRAAPPIPADAGPPAAVQRKSRKDFDHKAGTCGCFFLLVVGTLVALAVGGWYGYSQLELSWARQIAEHRLQDDFGNRWKITSEEIAPRVDEAAFKGTVDSEDRARRGQFRMILTKENGKWRVLSITTNE